MRVAVRATKRQRRLRVNLSVYAQACPRPLAPSLRPNHSSSRENDTSTSTNDSNSIKGSKFREEKLNEGLDDLVSLSTSSKPKFWPSFEPLGSNKSWSDPQNQRIFMVPLMLHSTCLRV